DLDDLPVEGAQLVGKRLEVVRLGDLCALLQPVPVHDRHKVVESLMSRGHEGFPVGALLELTVAEEDERPAGGSVHAGGECLADGDGQAVSEGAGACFDRRELAPCGVAVEHGLRLEEGTQRLRVDEAAHCKGGVQGVGSVALGEHKPVAFRVTCLDPLRADVHHGEVEGDECVRDRELATDVSSARGIDGLDGTTPDLRCRSAQVRDDYLPVAVRSDPSEYGDLSVGWWQERGVDGVDEPGVPVLRGLGAHASFLMQDRSTSWTSFWDAMASCRA